MTEPEGSDVEDLRERLEVFGAFMGGIIMEFDRELRYERIWTAQPGLLALPPEDLIGRHVRDVIGAREMTLIEEAVARLEATGEPVALDYVLDVPDGRRSFSAEVRLRHAGDRPTYLMLIRDVTEERALEAKLLQTERLAALGLLAASVMHEIRQPLAYLLTSIEVVERELAGAALGATTTGSLANIRDGGRRIAEIAGSLDFLAGRRERRTSAFDVRVPIQAALDLCSSALAGVVLDRDTPQPLRVHGDESELCQVITNLLLNSAQSFGDGSAGPHRVAVRTSLYDGRVSVAIEDNGPGIPAPYLPRVFDPFFTTKDRGRGTGLGLFISRGIVEAQGGTLRITSESGRGTTVEVLLPVAQDEEGSVAPISSTKPSAARRRLKLLVVDDERRFRESLRLALSVDHDVETNDGARAIAAVEAEPERYDLVLCDLAMAGVDGVTFHERMRSLGVADRFILMTGGAFTARAADFAASQACPVITKPFAVEELLALIDRVLVKQARAAGA
ncbi:MAG: response regulator [Labilithrix sp.]|nr:response regulator [Labilithrix sp.]MCW5815238.1 response regulator [Labilithrix sp.]